MAMTQPDAPVVVKPTLRMLLEDRLGEPLEGFVVARRPATSWRLIAYEITQRTGLDLTGEALRGWFG